MMKRIKTFSFVVFIFLCFTTVQANIFYKEAFSEIDDMLSGSKKLNFQRAVFVVENAYFENQLNEEVFNGYIEYYASICRGIINSGNIVYPETDLEKASAQCATFLLLTDTIPVNVNGEIIPHTPSTYNYDDFAGQKEWSSTFVSTLIETKKGNCHSLPFLYKMIMDELRQEAYLSLAPNHMYIKVQNKRAGWYNVELTNGDFPTDAWLMASGYVHTDAIRNGIYMDTLSLKQSVVLCLIDLAQGYQAKFGMQDGSFILQCCETALTHFPNYINALLLKAETLTALYQQAESESDNNNLLLAQMNGIYTLIHSLGYRKMPQNMYINWLNSLSIHETNQRMKSLIIR